MWRGFFSERHLSGKFPTLFVALPTPNGRCIPKYLNSQPKILHDIPHVAARNQHKVGSNPDIAAENPSFAWQKHAKTSFLLAKTAQELVFSASSGLRPRRGFGASWPERSWAPKWRGWSGQGVDPDTICRSFPRESNGFWRIYMDNIWIIYGYGSLSFQLYIA